jgi:peptide/nickel transport system substrate-binding protein
MKKSTGIRFGVGAVSLALSLTACGGESSSATGDGSKGGTLYILSSAEQILHLDPQRNYTGEDLAFASAYLNRTLTQYTLSKDNSEASQLVADAATDTGTTPDGGLTWEFTLKDGMKWEDGKDVTCEDFKYGISRTFATDIITGGATYAMTMLNVADYQGPYVDDAAGQASYDSAVVCEGNKIIFNLASPASDFNYAVTLSAFAAVRKDADTGATYDDNVLSNGPYKIESYVKKDKLVLVRNKNWNSATDTFRGAYPDRIEYVFAQPTAVITERLMADVGDDQMAISRNRIDPEKLSVVFTDSRYEKRRYNELDPYVLYYAINTKKVPNVKHRQAILAAVNRDELRKIAGGEYAGDYADGVVNPSIGVDYAPTSLWDGLLGDAIPAEGNPELAIKLIAESGEAFPQPFVIDYGQSETNDKEAASLSASLAKAGIVATLNPLEEGSYYGVVLDPEMQGSMSASGWASDWSNASTVIPELFAANGEWNISQWDDEAFLAESEAAKAITDRAQQAKAWQALSKKSMELALALPTIVGKKQRIHGSKVSGAYIWGPYGSWSYASLSVN